MAITFAGGILFGWFFQNDEYRNLFIMGIAHGVGGTLVGMLTPIEMNVGPLGVIGLNIEKCKNLLKKTYP